MSSQGEVLQELWELSEEYASPDLSNPRWDPDEYRRKEAKHYREFYYKAREILLTARDD